jgi:hypothetical protein
MIANTCMQQQQQQQQRRQQPVVVGFDSTQVMAVDAAVPVTIRT